MDLSERRAMWRGFGGGMTMAVEMAVVPALFALAGMVIDRALGTRPAFMIGLMVFAAVGGFLRAYYAYCVAAQDDDRGKPWARQL